MFPTSRVVVALAFATFLTAGAPVSAQTWSEWGPAPTSGFGGAAGRMSAIACSRTNPGLYFVGGADGGVWRSTNAGAAWTPVTDSMPTSAIGALAIDPTDESLIYAGMGEANFANHSRYGLGLLKSINGGDTWAVLVGDTFAGRCFSRIAIANDAQHTLYAAIAHAGGFPALAAAKMHPLANGRVGVFKSIDGGVSWMPLEGGLPALDATDVVVSPLTPNVVYAAIGNIFGSPENGIYRSGDGGVTWSRQTNGLPSTLVGRIGLAMAPSNPLRIYSTIATQCDAFGGGSPLRALTRTDDGGNTWSTISTANFQSTYSWYFATAIAHPTDPGIAFFGGVDLVRTINNGTSFNTVSPPHPDSHSYAWDAAGRLLVGDDGGIHRSANLGTQWEALNAGLGTIQCYAGISTHPTDASIVFAGLQDNGTVRRSSSSLIWQAVAGGDGGWTQVDQTNPQRVFVESQGTGNLSRSINGGTSFSPVGGSITGRNCFLPPYLIDPANSSRMIYGTERVWQSIDGGSSWTPLSPDLTGGGTAAIRALAIAPSNSNYVYAATNDGRVLVSTNGGSVFTLVLTGNPGWPRITRELIVDPRDPRVVYLAGSAFGSANVRRSVDAGANWETLDGDLPDLPVNVIALDVRPVRPRLFAGTDAGLYQSRDEGQHWTRYGAGLPNTAVIDIVFEPGRNRLVVATQGRGVWSAPVVYCPADFDDGSGTGTPDGGITLNDLLFYLDLYAAGDVRADVDDGSFTGTRDRGVTIEDLLYLLVHLEAGC